MNCFAKKISKTILFAALPIVFLATTGHALAITYGASTNPTSDPIGGGTGYSRIIDPATATYTVSTKSQLLSALASATSGQIIYVTDTAQIDLTGEVELIIPSGVTLASGRGRGGSQGARLYLNSNVYTRLALFKIGGVGVRITGIRIEGADGSVETCTPAQGSYCVPIQAGIYSEHNVEIDNTELSKWSYTAIDLVDTNLHIGTPYIHYNYIHHNTRAGLGYGIALGGNSDAIVEYNIFDYNRHSIADEGLGTSSYIARYNTVLGHGIGHAFDMHGGSDRLDNTTIAGKRIDIYSNTFYRIVENTSWGGYGVNFAVVIRGIPVEGAFIHDNYLYYDKSDSGLGGDPPILQTYCVYNEYTIPCATYEGIRNFNVSNNCYNGVTETGAACTESTPTPTPIFKTADLNADGIVNSVDFGILLSAWGNTAKPKSDINQDGIVNSIDFGIMMSQWG